MSIYLVTGASSGIGREMAKQLAGDGHTVYAVARRKEALDELAKEAGGRVVPFVCNVTYRDAVHSICLALPTLPDYVILNAGIGRFEPSRGFDFRIHEDTFATNYFGAIHFVDELLPKFIERKSGTFVAVSSLAARRGLPRIAAYGASKAALTWAFESMRAQYSKHGVGFVTVHPGFVDTPMTTGQKGMMFLWPVQRAARHILKRLHKGALDISFPLGMRLITGLLRLLPARLHLALAKRI